MTTHSVLIAGGGIAGMSAAVAMARVGWQPTVYERAEVFAEVGAGVQLGPNVTRLLRAWGAQAALAQVAAQPKQLVARRLDSGESLAALPLEDMPQRYGAPYVTVHRADLHGILLDLARAAGAALTLGHQVHTLVNDGAGVLAYAQEGQAPTSHRMALVADGVWSQLRQQLLADGPAQFTGHVAYRALVSQAALPAAMRTQDVTVWMGPKAHVVHYPVRGGDWLNVVCLVEDATLFQPLLADAAQSWRSLQTWNTQVSPAQTQQSLQRALQGAHRQLQALAEHCTDWRVWPLCGRTPLQGAHQMAQGSVALVGDAAHPMLPYLAQGAGMAIEDAAVLEKVFQQEPHANVAKCLHQFATRRWQRNARVQARAMQIGQIFHATGLLRLARDAGLKWIGATLMDVPWLYGEQV